MSFEWLEYLRLAQELTQSKRGVASREAKLRSAVSRAYYAAFIKARNHLRDEEGYNIPDVQDAHYLVRAKFFRSSDHIRRRIGQHLHRLRTYRNQADYNDVFPGLPSIARTCLKLAQEVIADLDQL